MFVCCFPSHTWNVAFKLTGFDHVTNVCIDSIALDNVGLGASIGKHLTLMLINSINLKVA